MTTDVHAQLVQMTKMLANLGRWLDKAEQQARERGFDPAVFLQARLSPDMFPLVRQIQNSCDGVKFLAARLAGKQAPKHEDGDQGFAELRARVREVIEYAESFGPEDFVGIERRVVSLPFLPGKSMAALDYLNEMVVPNTYFHLVTAYALLRHNGVPLGKMDYIGRLTLRDA